MSDARARFRKNLERWIAPLEQTDKLVVLDWVEAALRGDAQNPDDFDAQLLAMLVEEQAEIIGVKDGQVTFRLTAAGMRRAEELIATDPKSADLHDRLVAKDLNRLLAPRPKRTQ